MNTLDRRAFLKTALAGAGAIALPWFPKSSLLAATERRFAANDLVTLGKTGLVASRLALGSGTVGVDGESNQTRMGVDNFVRIIRHGFERGITFWDTADQYGSHSCFREALKYVPREKVVILTKSNSSDAGRMKQDLERFRKELGVDYIDIFLLHCMAEGNWPEKMKPVMDVLGENREKKIVRACGVSCHRVSALQAAARDPWTDLILARLNHAGVAMDAAPDKVTPVLREGNRNGKSIMAMKIVGVGQLRDQIDQSLNFVLAQGFVDALTIGFESTQELDQMIRKIAAVRV